MLSRKNQADSNIYRIKPLEMGTILMNLHIAAQHPLIGHGDYDESLKAITERMNVGVVEIKKSDLEAGLWACNMLDELGEFWSPYVTLLNARPTTEFTRLLERVELPYGYRFDRFYNTIEDKRRRPHE